MAYTPQITIRKSEKSDDEQLQQISTSLFPNSRIKDKEGDVWLVAEVDGAIAGFCHFRLREKTCYIAGLGVLPAFRNHGLGSLLLARALEIVDAEGIQTTLLKVRALNPASNLYVKFGFFEKKAGETLVLERKKMS